MKSSLRFAALISLLCGAYAAKAQPSSQPPQIIQPLDSSKIYVYVAKMPAYPGGRAALITDLRQAFQVASAAAGCSMPAFPVYVRLLVGPSGYVYAARSLNAEEAIKRRQSAATAANLPELPAACEAALSTAARHLKRLQPGRQANKPVTVELVVKLLDGTK